MAVRRGGLAPAQLAELARKLEVGGRPRVRLSGPQFPPDTVGTVVRIGEPATDGEDFVTVRARIGGIVDELAFSPAELTIASKAGQQAKASPTAKRTAKRTAQPAATRAPRAQRPAPAPDPAPIVAPATLAPAPAPAVSRPAPAPAVAESAAPPAVSAAPPAVSAAPPAVTNPRRGAATPNRRSTPTAPITITLASAGADWTVSVERGARSLLKKASITPGAVTAVAALLAQPGVIDAVAAVNETARNEAEARAATLRAELAEVQAVLDSHRTP